MTYSSKIELIQAAITRIGEQPITSLDDKSLPAKIINANYEGMLRQRLSMHTWSFASLPVKLVYQGEIEVGIYRHAYIYPPEALRVHWVGKDRRRLQDYHIHQNKILTYDDGEKFAYISIRPPENEWSADFAQIFMREIQSLLIGALRREVEAERMTERDVEVKYRNAIAADKRQRPGTKINIESPLIQAHRGY